MQLVSQSTNIINSFSLPGTLIGATKKKKKKDYFSLKKSESRGDR